MIRPFALLALAPLLGGCFQTLGGGSVVGGECKVFERPPYAVRGARTYDQDWIDSTIEGGVGACKWQRPEPRPAELDAAPAPISPAAKPVKKPGVLARVKSVWPKKVAPLVALPETAAPVESTPATPLVEPPKPRSKIDELLHPSEWLHRTNAQ